MHWLIPILKKEIRESDSILDLCCGHGLVMGSIKCAFYLGVDIDRKELEKYAALGKADSLYMQADVTCLPKNWCSYKFDVVVCVDGVEHLIRKSAGELLSKMEHWGKKAIIVTPDRFFSNDFNDTGNGGWNTEHQRHKSLITEEEFEHFGYRARVRQPEVLGHNCMVYIKEF